MRDIPAVTMFADASWCPDTQAGGWAVWLRAGGEPERYGGRLKERYGDSRVAEAAALANGIAIVARRYPCARLIAQSDCQYALRVVSNNPPKKLRKADTAVRDHARATIAQAKLTIDLRYVPAHRGYVDRRSAVNEWCDGEAKRHMRAMRREIQAAAAADKIAT